MNVNNLSDKDILDLHFDKRLRDFVHTSFPAKITRVINSALVDVQPLITTLRPDNSVQPYPELFDVRMQTYACQLGDVYISLPTKVGDLVWVMASERDTSLLMASDASKAQPSTTQRTHDLSDCFCIPAFFPDGLAKEYDPDNLVIGNKNTMIIVKADGIEITTSEASITADNLTVNANLQVNGNTSLNGSVEATGDTFTHNNVNVGSTHTHLGVQTGSGTSGTPTP
jgi:phage baseplate assembly protein gpV